MLSQTRIKIFVYVAIALNIIVGAGSQAVKARTFRANLELNHYELTRLSVVDYRDKREYGIMIINVVTIVSSLNVLILALTLKYIAKSSR